MIFTDLAQLKAPGQSWDRVAQEVNNITPREYFAVMRKAQNFLKHADKDPDEALTLDERETESLMFFATLNAGPLDGISTSQQVFQVWYFATHEEKFAPEFEHLPAARAMFQKHSHDGP